MNAITTGQIVIILTRMYIPHTLSRKYEVLVDELNANLLV